MNSTQKSGCVIGGIGVLLILIGILTITSASKGIQVISDGPASSSTLSDISTGFSEIGFGFIVLLVASVVSIIGAVKK